MDDFPTPPGWRAQIAGHHWLEQIDGDGHSRGLVVLQWNPRARKWSASGMVGTGSYYPVGPRWKYVAECPLPHEDRVAGLHANLIEERK